jgi:hypothetical protein
MMLGRILGSTLLATMIHFTRIRRAVKVEKALAGAGAITVRSLIARRMLMAHAFQQMKRQRSQAVSSHTGQATQVRKE